MALAEIVTLETIKVGLARIDKATAIRALVDAIVASAKAADRGADGKAILAAVLDREAKGSTGLENGIAIPHARTTGVAGVVCAIGISRDGIDFDSADHRPCHLIFLIVAPPEASTPYLKALSSVALIGRDAGLVERLKAALSPEEVLELLAEVN
jgi:mannitol/fructose-specific phosphotransferase system IIA component (Ntr-type)